MSAFGKVDIMAINDLIKDIDNQLSQLFRDKSLYDLSPFSVFELRNSLIFEMIKTAYDRLEPKKSLRSHRGTDDDYARMLDSRNKAYVQHYRNIQYKEMRDIGWNEPELLSQDVSSIEGRLDGHKLSGIQYYEMDALAVHPLLKTIVSKRICDVKKISNATFCEYMEDFEQWVESLIDMLNGDDEDVIFATVELFTLEWKYSVELFYRCAVEAETQNYTEVDKDKLAILCADVTMPQPLNPACAYTTHSRFIPYRNYLVPYMYNGYDWEEIHEKLFEYLIAKEFIIVTKYYGKTIIDEFCEQTTKSEWAAFIRENFNLKDAFSKNEWTNKRIRYVRKLYNVMTKNMPTPPSK